MEPVILSPVRDADSATFFDLFVRVRAHDLGAAAWPEAIRAATLRIQFDAHRRGYGERYPAADTSLLIDQGEPIGWAVVDRAGTSIHLVDIAVLPERRGRGAATAVLRALQDEAAHGTRPLTLTVLRGNLAAIGLYSRLGFEPAAADDLNLHLQWRQPSVAAPAPGPAPLTADTFRAALNTWFEIERDGGPLFLLLKEVDERPLSGGMRRFNVLFHGPGGTPLPQDSYTVKHPSFGELLLFMVPVVGSSAALMLYEVCFSYRDGGAA